MDLSSNSSLSSFDASEDGIGVARGKLEQLLIPPLGLVSFELASKLSVSNTSLFEVFT